MAKHPTIITAHHAIDLDDYDPADTGDVNLKQAETELPALSERLVQLQTLLYAAAHQSVLVVLQGLDTSGKDGTIAHVLSHVNPLGCQVWNFKVPSEEEHRHDFLWRVHQKAPPTGILTIFNRSHYESVLVERVHGLVPKDVWHDRFEQINDFESLLSKSGTIILKFFLHISKDEQKQRLLDREKTPDKAWKLSLADWKEREYWNDYQKAYEDAISKCATKQAPWYIVPANKKWYRNYVIANAIVDTLKPYEKAWKAELEQRGQEELKAIRQAGYHHD